MPQWGSGPWKRGVCDNSTELGVFGILRRRIGCLMSPSGPKLPESNWKWVRSCSDPYHVYEAIRLLLTLKVYYEAYTKYLRVLEYIKYALENNGSINRHLMGSLIGLDFTYFFGSKYG